MLAKELKIKNLRKQREFIEEQLSNANCREDGATTYRYIGNIYPEVIEYFEEEGFAVTKVQNDLLTAMTEGKPVYVFSVRDDLKLTDEELKEAEAYEVKKEYAPEEKADDFLEMLLGSGHPF